MSACGGGSSSPTSSPTPSATSTQLTSTEHPSASPSPSESSSPKPSITPSTNTDAITVTGDFGKSATVTFTAPWAIDKTQARVISEGTGAEIADTSMIEIQYHGVNGRTGKVFDESFTSGKPLAFSLAQVIPGFKTGLVGKKVGSRVLLAITGADGYDSMGGSAQAGIEVGDTLIFVVDILTVSLTEPSGAAQAIPAGLPTVSDDLKKPVVTIPTASTPPTNLVVQPIIVGTGRKLAATDGIRVDYAEYAWSTGKVVKQTYGYKPLDGLLSQTIPGWQEALVGQPVGSRVLLIVPPAKAYPSGNPRSDVKAGETMVYVVDILFASPQG